MTYNQILIALKMFPAIDCARSLVWSLLVEAHGRRLRMIDEDENGVRVKVTPCPKEQLRRRLQQTNRLGDDFFMPNRAQLLFDF